MSDPSKSTDPKTAEPKGTDTGDKRQPLPDEGGVWIDTKDKETKPDSKDPIHETDTPVDKSQPYPEGGGVWVEDDNLPEGGGAWVNDSYTGEESAGDRKK